MGDGPHTSSQRTVSNESDISFRERIFSVLESAPVLTVIGIAAGLAGTFINGLWLIGFALFVPAAIYRSEKAVKGLGVSDAIMFYSLSTLGAATVLLCLGVGVNSSRLGELTQQALAAVIKAMPSTSVATTEEIMLPQNGTPAATSTPQDDLLNDARREQRNCNDFLARSKYRETHTYGVSIAIAEDKQENEFNDRLDKYDLGTKPPAVAKAQHEARQAQIEKEESIFSADEVYTWGKTYGPEFEPVYHKMMAAVGNPLDFDGSNPMKDPDSLGMIKHECSNLQTLIQKYTAMPQP